MVAGVVVDGLGLEFGHLETLAVVDARREVRANT